jgi:hypothetical protein
VNANKARIIDLIREIYKKHSGGGALHIVLDDGNIETHHIQWCIDNAILNHEFCTPEDESLYLECAQRLLKMTKGQRGRAIYAAFCLRKKGEQ